MKAIVFGSRGCSAGWLGCYGNEWIGTPNLDRLAAEGIVFDRCISDCPAGEAACLAWLTGSSKLQAKNGGLTVLKSLRAAGVHTLLVRANHPDNDSPDWFYADWVELFDARPQEEDRFSLDSLVRALPPLLDRLADLPSFLLWIDIDALLPPWNVRQDVFQAYVEDAEEEPDYPEKALSGDESEEVDVGGDEVETAGDSLADANGLVEAEDERGSEEGVASEEIFGFQEPESAEAATPWLNPPTGEFDREDAVAREWLQWSLAALMTGFDAELGAVFERLRAKGLDESALWLFTSDFGYPLGEHGQIGRHRAWLYEEFVHLPLIVRLPKAEEACRRVEAFAQPPDIAPTLLHFFGIEGSPGMRGIDLTPLLRGASGRERECAISHLKIGDSEEYAIRTKEWAYLLPKQVPEGEKREPQLFGKPHDRWEVDDMSARNLERTEELDRQLRQFMAAE